MAIVLTIHSIVRWLILAVAVVAVIKYALGWQQRKPFTSLDQRLGIAFSGLMDLQALLGLGLLLFLDGGFPMYRIEHAVTMILAVVAGHLPARWKRAPDALRFRNGLAAIVVALLLVLAGIARLPGGLSR